jgi:SulP family sulfate permease
MTNLKTKYFSNLKGDMLGGLTAGIVALPLALAFGVASGLGAAAGIYGAIFVGILAAIFGGTPAQVSGPTGPMTVVVAGIVAATTGNPAIVFAAVALAGLLQIGLGFLRVGSYIRFIPYPVISGFMSGIGVIIIAQQIRPFLGEAPRAKIIEAIFHIPDALMRLNPMATALGVLAVALVYLAPKVLKGVPGSLVAIVVGTAVAAFFNLDVPRIGDLPQGLPSLQLPPFNEQTLSAILMPALVLALLGSIDSLLTSLVADNITKTRHDSNQELIGQGIGNTVSGLFGGLPGAGATMRTVVNVKAGGKTPLSGAIHGLVLIAALLGLGKLAALVPLSVLAGILITVGIGIIDYKGLRHALAAPRSDTAIMLVVFVLTVFVDLIQAVAVGFLMAAVLLVKRLSDMFGPRVLPLADSQDMWADEAACDPAIVEHVFIYHLEGPLFFGTANEFSRSMSNIRDYRVLIFRFDQVPFLDQSAAYALEDALDELESNGIEVYMTGLRPEVAKTLGALGIVPGRVPPERIFPDFAGACRAVAERLPAVLEAESRAKNG